MSYVLFPDSADAQLNKSARQLGETMLGRAPLAKSAGGHMPDWLQKAHQRTALSAGWRDLGRMAGQEFRHGRELSEIGKQGVRVREALDHGDAATAARLTSGERVPAGRDAFEPRETPKDLFTEPFPRPDEFETSGRIEGADYETGYDYTAGWPAHPMARAFGPPVNAKDMNRDRELKPTRDARPRPYRGQRAWDPSPDFRPYAGLEPRSQSEMTEGSVPEYRPDEPYRAGALSGTLRKMEEQIAQLGARVDSHVANVRGGTTFAKSLDAALAHKTELGDALYRDFIALRTHLHDAARPDDWRRSSEFASVVERIECAAVAPSVKRQLVSALN